jgi:hypothetical protein
MFFYSYQFTLERYFLKIPKEMFVSVYWNICGFAVDSGNGLHYKLIT